jgi:hypothetical protein
MEKCVHRTHIPPLLPAKVNRGTTLQWKKWSSLKSNLIQQKIWLEAVLCYVYDVLVRIWYNRKSDWKLSCVMYTMYLWEFDTTENLIGSCPVLCIRCTCENFVHNRNYLKFDELEHQVPCHILIIFRCRPSSKYPLYDCDISKYWNNTASWKENYIWAQIFY